MRIIGQNKGFDQEDIVRNIVNNKQLNQLNNDYQNLIKKMFGEKLKPSSIIYCYKNEGSGIEKKNDLTFETNNLTINTSVKRGSQNSVHQEKLSTFLVFLNSIRILNQREKDLINKFHWCDETIDNSGLVKDRMPKSQFKKMFTKDYDEYLEILRGFKKEIFFRVWVGSVNIPQFLIYFDGKNNIPNLIKFDDILTKHLKFNETGDSIGLLTFQNCWACLKGQDHGHKSHKCDFSCPKITHKTIKHRLDIQFKSKDIKEFIL